MTILQDAADRLEAEPAVRQLMLCRNAAAVRETARRHALSKSELERMVRKVLEEQMRVHTDDRIGQRYDIDSGRYLTLEEWVAQLLRR